MRILVAEDDSTISEALVYTLCHSGYDVEAVGDGDAAEAALAASAFDLLILDLGLPKKSGLEVLRSLRARSVRIPVLILTALDDLTHRVQGLDAGADDYLQKPFEFAELEARVRALARRGASAGALTFALGGLEFDRTARIARVRGERLELTARETALLEALLERAGRLVSRDQLAARLGQGSEEAGEMALEAHAQRLGRLLAPGGVGIVSVPALGLCLEQTRT